MSENKQITSEGILFSPDIIEKIFSHLNVKDLRRAAGVCWYWHEIAKKEILDRSTIESLILPLYITPYNHGFCPGVSEDVDGFFECYNKIRYSVSSIPEEIDLTDNSDWHVSEAVRCKPKMLLIFCDDHTDTEYPFYQEYMKYLPKYSLYADIQFLKITVDGTELYGETNLGSGISIPSTSNLSCEMYNIDDDDIGYFEDEPIDDCEELMLLWIQPILKELNMLVPATAEENNCFILFLNRTPLTSEQYYRRNESVWKYESYVTEFLNSLKKKFKPGTYSVLGTGCTVILTSLNNNPWLDPNFTFFVRIHGSALKSWSTVISFDLSLDEMKDKLLDLKKKIHINSSTIALCTVPVDKKKLRRGIRSIKNSVTFDYFDPSVIFKQLFPSVTLTCVYDNKDYFQFGCNTLDIESNPVFKHKNSMIFLFITTT